MPKLEKYLEYRNCATRKEMGTSYAIKLLKKDTESFKKYNKFYFLKLDISKYFYSLDHDLGYTFRDKNNKTIVKLNTNNKNNIKKV